MSKQEVVINAEQLTLLKPMVFLINTARSGLVEGAALAPLKKRRRAGAGLDVFENEPPGKDDALFPAPNTVVTPHLGYKAREVLLKKLDVIFRNIVNFEQGTGANRLA